MLTQTLLTPAHLDAILDAARTHDLGVRSYSARHMYGATCFAVTVDAGTDPLAAFANVVLAIADVDLPLARTLADTVCVDTLGVGSILYWPRLAAADLDDDDSDDPC